MALGWTQTRSVLARVAALAAGAVLLSGCQSIQGTSPSSPEVRFVAASPDAPGLDFYLNSSALVYNLGYNSQTNYIPVNAGNYTVNADKYSTNQVLATAGLGVRTGNHYTVIAGNIQASLQLQALTDQTGPSASGQVNFRLIDQSVSSGAIDVYLVPSGGKLTTTNPIATNLTFSSLTGYIPVPAGTYQVAIVPAGTVPISTTITSFTGASTVYNTGAAVTLLVDDKQLVTTPTLNVVTLNDYPN